MLDANHVTLERCVWRRAKGRGVEEAGEGKAKQLRGAGRGSKFFVLGRDVAARLWEIPTSGRLYLVLTYLTLLAGTGIDQRLTKWSAKACEEYLGVGRPRARAAIEELIAAGLIERSEISTRMTPQYRLPDTSQDEDPIFLPVQIVTGFKGEASVLRRVRETGDAMLLKMLLDLYGGVQLDATYGLPIGWLRQGPASAAPARKIAEVGVHALWALTLDQSMTVDGTWYRVHHSEAKSSSDRWAPMWERIRTLERIGALVFEPWAFDGEDDQAEPLFPVDFSILYTKAVGDEVAELSGLCYRVAEVMTIGREYLLDQGGDLMIALPSHHRPPAIRGVAKLRIEPDTPGCRRSYALRMKRVGEKISAYQQLLDDMRAGRFDRPLGAPT